MYTDYSVNRYDYVICSNDSYGVIHHIPSKVLVKCSSTLAESLRAGIEQEPVDSQTARYLIEHFEKNVYLDISSMERKLIGLEIFMSQWHDAETDHAEDEGCCEEEAVFLTEEVIENMLSFLKANYDEVGSITFISEELDQEYAAITYICRRMEEEFAVSPDYRLAGYIRSIPEAFMESIEKYRIRLCSPAGSTKGIYGCLGDAMKKAVLNHALKDEGFKEGEKIFCEAGLKIFSVDPNGDIYPCHAFSGQKEWLMGNIQDMNWRERQECLKIIRKLQKMKKGCVCSKCTARESCTHCMATIALEWNGDCNGACYWKRRCNEYALLNYCKS